MKNQLHGISGVNSGLEVRVLPGSPLPSPKRLLSISLAVCPASTPMQIESN